MNIHLDTSEGSYNHTLHGEQTASANHRVRSPCLPQRSGAPRAWPCGEEELVGGVHTLVAGVVQVYHRLHVVEEEEQGRKVDQEVEREDQGEETARTWMSMEMT